MIINIFIQVALIMISFPCQLFADNRGLVIKTKLGKSVELYRTSYALIIGNGNYAKGWEQLPGALKDVEEVSAVLKKRGFEVILKTNLSKEAFDNVFSEFSVKFGKKIKARLLIYYAGHGFSQKLSNGEDLGYLVMVDTPLPDKDPIGFDVKSVDMVSIITQAKKMEALHVLFIFDSCFSGSILNMRDRVIPQFISDNIRYPVRQFITAGRANEPVPDQSVFKQAFLDILEGRVNELIPDGYLTGEELGLYLKNIIPEYNPSQHPQYGKIRDPKLDKGDFVFEFKKTIDNSMSMETENMPSVEIINSSADNDIQTFQDNFEKGLNKWKIEEYSGYNQLMKWHISTNNSKSGVSSLSPGNEDTDIKDNVDSVLIETKQCFILHNHSMLKFDIKKSYGINLKLLLIRKETDLVKEIKFYPGNSMFQNWKSVSLPLSAFADNEKYSIAFESWNAGQLFIDNFSLSYSSN